MKFIIIQYVQPILLVVALPIVFIAILCFLIVRLLFEKVSRRDAAPLPAHYYKLTSWEDDREWVGM